MIRFYNEDFSINSEFIRVKEANEFFDCKHCGIYNAVSNSTKFRGLHVIDTEKKKLVRIFLMKWLSYIVLFADDAKAIKILKIAIQQMSKA